jgi:hypothetical protein
MKISYVENNNGKLFSFSRHNYKENKDNDGNYVMIDGGFDYNRYSGRLKEGEIKDLMEDIRNQFTWGQNYDENNNKLPKTEYRLLKDLSISHISGIIRYFIEKLQPESVISKNWLSIHLIFCYELENRLKYENNN